MLRSSLSTTNLESGAASFFLEEHGYTVLTAVDGAQAQMFIERCPGIALMLTDIVMPGKIDGFELGAWATQVRPRLKIIYMSGYLAPQRRSATTQISPVLLTKPFTFDRVLKEIAAALR